MLVSAVTTVREIAFAVSTLSASSTRLFRPFSFNHEGTCNVNRESDYAYGLRPHRRELRTQKLKSHLMRTHSLKVLPLKPGVGQYIALLATLTARDFFLANFYPSGPFTCFFFFKTSSEIFLC